MQNIVSEGRKGQAQMSSITGQIHWTRAEPDSEGEFSGQVTRHKSTRQVGRTVQGVG